MKWQLQNLNSEQRQAGARAALSALLLAVSLLVAMPSLLKDSLLLVAYVLVGGEILAAAVKNLRHGRLFDENFLMAIATIGALLIGQFAEAVAVMLFYQIGEFFQDLAVANSKQSISALLKLRPDFANLVVGPDKINPVKPELVAVGDLIQVKPGEKVPLDGQVVAGESYLDTAG